MSSVKCGIVGLPNVGKSTLFNALLKKRVALSANYPFATVEPNIGVVAVPDLRLQKLAELTKNEERMTNLPPIVPAVCEFVDIAGLVKGAATGAGLGNKFLSHIREVDAIIHVLRDFSDPNIVREGSINPDEDKLTIETELGLADLEVLEKLLMDKTLDSKQLDILNRIKVELDAGHVLGKFEVGDEKLRDWFSKLPLISIKPVLYVFNVAESEIASKARNDGNEMTICAKLEEELADLNEEERLEYLKEIGIEETGLERLIKKAYSLLGLISFLTEGVKEVRAWTIKAGSKGPEAAGAIHTDFIKGFIRAQVVSYDKLIEAGSMAQAKAKGWVRTEGRDYIVQDGDVIEFLIGS
ncbi:redox-regulated ATPase YchF [Candidatus Daviesbacteria bacterium RIFCSPHIGHO2_02_FULL_36_13]|uniref:Ribosome-binding ATPase YchF n=1 Tax=Candidatus Daviesbacteria bacterium RIFCSPHIGHO2_02_FULL_36_13 TaxID=1797768 RepID=A0A1F5JQA5_9BACT|nr:MAG: redox-regulated ATPase YchF [Candidatus Daviesbacteria bacterium RIFCSPHIGHO2_02_FULL_36_13]